MTRTPRTQKTLAFLLVLLFAASALATLPIGLAEDGTEDAAATRDDVEAPRADLEPRIDGLRDRLVDGLPSLGGDPRTDSVGLIVRYGPQGPDGLDHIVRMHDGQWVREDTVLDFVAVRVPVEQADAFRAQARALPGVADILDDVSFDLSFVPDDPRYPYQWGPAAIGAETFWDTTTGNTGLTVAVLDTGVDADHPDLADNLCGPGYDFGEDDNDTSDPYGHGTYVTGVLAAEIDNALGTAGVADVCVLPLKVAGFEDISLSATASAVRHAADSGADIIQISFGTDDDPGAFLHDAVRYAADAGVLIVAAAGNDYCGDEGVDYPAAYGEVIAVGAVDADGDPASFTACGDAVEVAAPGVDIQGIVPTEYAPSGYANESGTSVAASFVAGAAALVMDANPALSVAEVRCVLAQKAAGFATGHDPATGYGTIDLAAIAADPTCAPGLPEAPVVATMSGAGHAYLGWNTPFAFGGVDGYHVYRGDTPDDLTLYDSLGATHAFADDNVTTGETWHYAVAAVNPAGEGDLSDTVAVTVEAAKLPGWTTDFEDGTLGDWEATGLWHATAARGNGDHSAYFGNENGAGVDDNDMIGEDDDDGALVSPPLDLTGVTDASLGFWTWHEFPLWSDGARLEVMSSAAPGVWTSVWTMPAPYTGGAAVDLAAFAGHVVQVRFPAEAVSYWYDDTEGLYLDDIMFSDAAPTAYAPTASILEPETGEVLGIDEVVYGWLDDPNGAEDIETVVLHLDGTAVETHRYGPVWYTITSFTTTGEHTAEVIVTDHAGLSDTTNVTFTVDAEPPTVTVDPQEGPVDCRATFTGTAADTGGAGLSYVAIDNPYGWTYGLLLSGENETTWEIDADLTQMPAGVHELRVYSGDRAGNMGETVVTIDRSTLDCRPSATIEAPVDGTTVSDCLLTITGTARRGEGGAALRSVHLYAEHEHLGGQWLYDEPNETTWSINVSVGNLDAGDHAIYAIVYDTNYTSNTSAAVTVTRDVMDCIPKITIESPADGVVVGCTGTIQGHVSSPQDYAIEHVVARGDSRSLGHLHADGNKDGSFSIDVGYGRLEPGTYDVHVEAYDEHGQWNRSTSIEVHLDIDCRPSVTIDDPIEGATLGCTAEVTGTATAVDNDTIEYIAVYVGSWGYLGHVYFDEPAQEVSWSIDARLGWLEPGTHQMRAFVQSGNDAYSSSDEVAFVLAEGCTPGLTLDGPAAGETVSGIVTIEGTVDLPENTTKAQLEITLPDRYLSYTTTGGDWNLTWNTYLVPDGDHTIEAFVYIPETHGRNRTTIQVTVENALEPYVETVTAEGEVGCSVAALNVRTNDQCGNEDQVRIPVDPGLTGGRVVLSWDRGQIGDVDGLSLTVQTGAGLWKGHAGPGEDSVTVWLDGAEDRPHSLQPTQVIITVRAAHGGTPNVAYDEAFSVVADLAYWYAEI